MTMKWTMESAWAAIAVLVTCTGSVGTTIYRSGVNASTLADVQAHQKEQDDVAAAVALDLTNQKVLNAANSAAEQQALKDIKEQLDRMEKKL